MKESKFQSDLKEELKERFPGCIVTKLDSGNIQGIPDLLVLHNDKCRWRDNKRWLSNDISRKHGEYSASILHMC